MKDFHFSKRSRETYKRKRSVFSFANVFFMVGYRFFTDFSKFWSFGKKSTKIKRKTQTLIKVGNFLSPSKLLDLSTTSNLSPLDIINHRNFSSIKLIQSHIHTLRPPVLSWASSKILLGPTSCTFWNGHRAKKVTATCQKWQVSKQKWQLNKQKVT